MPPAAESTAPDRVLPEVGLLGRAPSSALVLCAIGSVQFGSAIAATLFSRIGPAGAVTLRLVAATVVLLALWRPRVRNRAPRELWLAVGFGLVLAAMNLSFYEALHRIPLGIAVTIEFAGPLTVAVAGSRRRSDFLWVALAAGGILALMRPGGHSPDVLGVLLALFAGGCWGAYILLNARVGRVFERATGLSLAMVVAAVAVLPFGVASGGSHLLEPRSLALGGAVGMLSSAIPYSFENEALRRIAPSVFGVLMSLEPAMATAAGFIVLHQHISLRALIGIAMVVVASVGAMRRSAAATVVEP